MTFMLMLTCSLISFGLSFVVTQTSGPFGLFGSFRQRVRSSSASEWIKDGIGCPICASFWLSIPVAACLAPDLATGVQLWLVSLGATCATVSLSPD